MNIKRAALALTILAAVMLTGCSADRWSSVESGEYVVAHEAGTANAIALSELQKLEIDRDKRLVVFTQVDGPKIVVSFVPREKATWSSDCQHLGIELYLVLGHIDFDGPNLVVKPSFYPSTS